MDLDSLPVWTADPLGSPRLTTGTGMCDQLLPESGATGQKKSLVYAVAVHIIPFPDIILATSEQSFLAVSVPITDPA
jgi:hypothetical protein